MVDNVAWRRATRSEAIEILFATFTLASMFRAGWGYLFEDAIDFEHVFFRSLWFSIAFAVSSMIIKMKPVFLK